VNAAIHLVGALYARSGAVRDSLAHGPSIHAAVAPAHAHAGGTPTACLTGAHAKESESGCDQGHCRTHD
jgi:hypothetical protein